MGRVDTARQSAGHADHGDRGSGGIAHLGHTSFFVSTRSSPVQATMFHFGAALSSPMRSAPLRSISTRGCQCWLKNNRCDAKLRYFALGAVNALLAVSRPSPRPELARHLVSQTLPSLPNPDSVARLVEHDHCTSAISRDRFPVAPTGEIGRATMIARTTRP